MQVLWQPGTMNVIQWHPRQVQLKIFDLLICKIILSYLICMYRVTMVVGLTYSLGDPQLVLGLQ